jgi:hypothetical protein
MSDRAQTTQDFAVGVGVFLLTVAFVLAYVPTALPQPTADAGASREPQADRIADELVDNLSVAGTGTRLNATPTDCFFEFNDDAATLRENFSLPASVRANVTLRDLDGTAVDHDPLNGSASCVNDDFDVFAGSEYRNQTAGSASRLVVYNGTRYRLLVRVW